jgi:putative ABC transport system permease protein
MTPPRLARRILLSFLRSDLAEEVVGDLDEKFSSVLKHKSLFHARLNYWYQVVNYLRPFAMRKTRPSYFKSDLMLRNYFKIGWRNMSRQKMYATIKVGGFALGIAACILMTLFIRAELKYDRHYPKGDSIYRVVEQFKNRGVMERGVHLPAPLGPVLKQDYPEVQEVARINPVELFGAGSNDIRRDGQVENTQETGFVWSDPELLQMLDLPFLSGDARNALAEPNSLVITKSKAGKFFPGEDPVGKIMIIANDEGRPYKIGGVIADPPETSHLRYHFFMSLSGKEFGQGEQTNWLQSNYPTYVLLQPGTDPVELGQKFQSLGEKYYLPRLQAVGYPNAAEEIKNLSYQLQPISEIYLNKAEVRDGLHHGDIRFIWLSAAITLFILIIACINFINLSTAKSANRAKEVGLRKVVGSFRSHLIHQFLTESVVYTFFSFLLGIMLAWIAIPFFNNLIGKTLYLPWQEAWFIPSLVAAALVVGLCAGIYPSFYLSSFKPSEVLKGKIAKGSRSADIRSVLVVFQFATSIVLIIGTFIIYKQMQFLLNAKIGFEKDQVMLIQGTNLLGDQTGTFKDELLNVPGVVSATVSDYLPIRGTKRNGNGFWNEGRKEVDKAVGTQFWVVDHDYLETLGIKLAEGRNFSRDMPTDSDAAVINQAMAKELGLSDPVGKRITNYKNWTVIGVVGDFHYETLEENVRPLCMVLGNSASIIAVKVNSGNIASTVGSVGAVWKQFAPQQPVRYTFLDESYARMYEDVQRMGRIFTSCALLAIIVACLGLFALSSYMVEQRSKEISIRLVLGASFKSIFALLTQHFVKLVLISFVIAAPIAWYIMQKWLEEYVYKTEIGWTVFLLAGAGAVLIALLTVSYQAMKAAFANPVTRLRSE